MADTVLENRITVLENRVDVLENRITVLEDKVVKLEDIISKFVIKDISFSEDTNNVIRKDDEKPNNTTYNCYITEIIPLLRYNSKKIITIKDMMDESFITNNIQPLSKDDLKDKIKLLCQYCSKFCNTSKILNKIQSGNNLYVGITKIIPKINEIVWVGYIHDSTNNADNIVKSSDLIYNVSLKTTTSLLDNGHVSGFFSLCNCSLQNIFNLSNEEYRNMLIDMLHYTLDNNIITLLIENEKSKKDTNRILIENKLDINMIEIKFNNYIYNKLMSYSKVEQFNIIQSLCNNNGINNSYTIISHDGSEVVDVVKQELSYDDINEFKISHINKEIIVEGIRYGGRKCIIHLPYRTSSGENKFGCLLKLNIKGSLDFLE